ncbi:MAG TPA: hypothetical protein VMR66_00290 [Gemmatimonadota bacterium]|nr:hypothetical protein [Gemmatimonadota bacterium]
MSATGKVGAGAALVGGLAALAGSALLPFHAGGGLGEWIAGLFFVAGLALALASIELGSRAPRARADRFGLRSWASLGAAGFVVGGSGLIGDVLERPIVAAEIAGVAAVAAWWLTSGRALRGGPAAGLGTLSLVLVALSMVALALQLVWSPPAGAVPARFAYALWGPWGVWLGVTLHRRRSPFPDS